MSTQETQKSFPRFSPRIPCRPLPLQTPPSKPTPSDPTHLTLRAGEALRTGTAEARVGSCADTPMQTGPGEAGVGLVLAVGSSVARKAQAAEGVHTIQTGPTIEAGAGGKMRVGQAPPPRRPRPPSWAGAKP